MTVSVLSHANWMVLRRDAMQPASVRCSYLILAIRNEVMSQVLVKQYMLADIIPNDLVTIGLSIRPHWPFKAD
jgi:hypothetical protein